MALKDVCALPVAVTAQLSEVCRIEYRQFGRIMYSKYTPDSTKMPGRGVNPLPVPSVSFLFQGACGGAAPLHDSRLPRDQ